MKNARIFLGLCFFLISTVASAHADLNIFLGDLNHRSYAAPNDYNYQLSTQFGVPQSLVSSLIRSVAAPSDAFMVLQLAHMLGLPHDRVLQTYNSNRGKGWGVIAKELGIKPGSAEFHALKQGDFALTGTPGNGKGHGKKNEQGYDFGQNQDKGQGQDKSQGQGKGQGQGQGKDKGKGKGHNK